MWCVVTETDDQRDIELTADPERVDEKIIQRTYLGERDPVELFYQIEEFIAYDAEPPES